MDSYTFLIRLSIFGIVLINTCTSQQKHFTHEWAVKVEGGIEKAKQLAVDYGFEFVDKIMDDYYSYRHNKVAKRSKFPSKHYHNTLAQDKNVLWLEQQVAKKRVKRYIEFNDPKWIKMWYLNRGGGLDMNVQKAWAMNVTGKGVAVTILDDGIETEHPDLKRNYDETASYDVNGHDPDPSPRYDFTNENRHGTRCAGEVAAEANNNECSVGVAFDANIGGVRMLDGDVTDSVEAQSLSLNPQHIQIYSASWGPDDDGRTVDGPATLARKAFYDGITRGRGGLGSIFVWASGNGGRDDDSCNCDGYTNSIYTLSISSVTENGKIPWYSEACSSTLATTYSSGSAGEKQIVTTDIRKSCTETHTGTSASAPLAAGLCALALQANSMLTWRDLQHIVVLTAKPDNLLDPYWITNGRGRKVSHSFGYGLMDAAAMVQQARNWTTVPPQHICEIRSQDHNKPVPMNAKVSVPLITDGCEGTANHVQYLEHVQARITLKASKRGEIQIYLTSPSGTTSTLLAKRSHDTSREGFNNWAFMTTHNWGETAKGQWVLVIENGARSFNSNSQNDADDFKGAKLKDWVLVLYGTDRDPQQSLTTTTSTTTTTTVNQRVPPELKDWTLVVMGTETQPGVAHNLTPPANSDQPFTCSGITSHGVCIECRPGYYKLKDGCVANCPEHYYGIMQMVQLRSTANATSSRPKFQRQGLCNECNEACRTCKGPAVSDCFQCKDGYERRDNLCQKKLLLNFLDPDMLGFFIWVIVLCIAAIILFGVIFGLLQARDRRLLCWKGKKKHLDARKCEYNGISLTQEELDNDLENFDIIRNRNFRHASLPESHDPLCRVHINHFETSDVIGSNNLNNVNRNSHSIKVDKTYSRNNIANNLSQNNFENSPDRTVPHENHKLLGHYVDRKSRSSASDKSMGRKHTDSYVSYDINSSLTRTLGSEIHRQISMGKSHSPGQEQPGFHGSRSAGTLPLRH